MNIKQLVAVAAIALSAASGASAQVSVFDTAFFELAPPGIVLNGFGRNTSTLTSTLSPQGVGNGDLGAPAPLPFFDTWNIGTTGVVPGVYNFNSLLVEAQGSATFTALTFNSFDAQGVRTTILFDINATGTAAVGSGSFTVLARCPVQSCVWIDVIGLRPVGAPWGYGGTGTALPVPEPGQWALFGLGLAAVAGAVRRRRGASA